MKTIEQYEIEIQSKISTCQQQLQRFSDNLMSIGRVIGKDPTHVYEIVQAQFDSTQQDYASMMNKNQESLSFISGKLDVILDVLAEVMNSIDEIEKNPDTEELSVKQSVDNTMEYLAENAESILSQVVANPGGDLFNNIVVGLSVFIGLKLIFRMGNIPSVAGAAAAIYLLIKANEHKDNPA